MKRLTLRIAAIFMVIIMACCAVIPAYAYLGRVETDDSGRASVSGTKGTLQNDWVSLEVSSASGGLPGFTLKPRVTNSGATYGTHVVGITLYYQSTDSYYKISSLKDVKVTADGSTLIYEGTPTDRTLLRAKVSFQLVNVDSGSLDYSGETYINGTSAGDTGNCWGVLVTVAFVGQRESSTIIYAYADLTLNNFGHNGHANTGNIYVDQFAFDTRGN